jgi:hypothetical protein
MQTCVAVCRRRKEGCWYMTKMSCLPPRSRCESSPSIRGQLIKGHRFDRVLGFFSSRPNWGPPTPSSAGKCVPPPFGSEGWGHTRLRGSVSGVPIRTRGQTLWYSCGLRDLDIDPRKPKWPSKKKQINVFQKKNLNSLREK